MEEGEANSRAGRGMHSKQAGVSFYDWLFEDSTPNTFVQPISEIYYNNFNLKNWSVFPAILDFYNYNKL